jgi:anti-sigma B factor antagonist
LDLCLPLEEPGECVKQSTPAVADDLHIAVDRNQEGTTLRLRGRLGIDSSPLLRDQLLAILKAPLSKVVTVDLTEVSYIDTSGIATLLEALKVARNRQTKFCVNGLQSRWVRLFEAAGLMNLFQMCDGRNGSSELKVS